MEIAIVRKKEGKKYRRKKYTEKDKRKRKYKETKLE